MPVDVAAKVRSFDICAKQRTHRGSKGGLHRDIPRIRPASETERLPSGVLPYGGVRPSNLVIVPTPRTKDNFQFPTLLMSNTRALANTLDKLCGFMQNNHVDIAIITESWLPSAGAQLLANISGYTPYHRPKSHRKDGGVALYVKNSIPVQQVNVKVPNGLERIWLLVNPSYLPREISSLVIPAVYTILQRLSTRVG